MEMIAIDLETAAVDGGEASEGGGVFSGLLQQQTVTGFFLQQAGFFMQQSGTDDTDGCEAASSIASSTTNAGGVTPFALAQAIFSCCV